MRSTLPRPALCLAALLLATPLTNVFAADPEPPAPAAATPSPATPSANDVATPVVAPAPEAAVSAPATTPAAGTETAPVAASPAPGETAVPAAYAPATDQASLEAKMAVVLRSYTLLQEENDQLRAAAEKSAAEKTALSAQLSVAKDALPAAAQVAGLREQLRQTQDQLAAMSLENNQLKTRLATLPPGPGLSNLTPTNVPTTLAPVAAPTPAATGPRIHVVVAGETLSKIAAQYYGNGNRWPEILAANKDVLKNEKSLLVGTKLKIP